MTAAIPRPADGKELLLYASWGCPFSHRVLAALHVTGLAEHLPVHFVEDVKREEGWRLARPDPVFGATTLPELYRIAMPGADLRPSVPVLLDRKARRIVSTGSREMVRFVATGLAGLHRPSIELCPSRLETEIGTILPWLNDRITRAVYRVGLTRDQASYESECRALFAALNRMEAHLADRPFLLGESLTEADLFLFPTLARFDAIYAPLFRCSLRRIADYPALSAYLARLLADPALAASFDLARAKRNYFLSVIHRPEGIFEINPSGIVPL